MVSKLGRTVLALCCAAVVPPAFGQAPAGGPAEPEIVVVGERGRERQLGAFVEALAIPSRNHQLGRADDGICPLSLGLAPRDNARFITRLRRVAEAAGVRRAALDCRPNLVLFVVPDKRAAIAHWRTKRADFFDGLAQRDIDRLANDAGPVAAWQIVHQKGVGRRAIAQNVDGIAEHYIVNHANPGRIGSNVQLEFFAAFIVIEAAALTEATLVQVADYAAMRTLARTDPQGADAQKLPTILSLFEAGRAQEAPPSVTQWDLAFLKALYGTSTAYSARDQQKAMTRALRRDLAGQEAQTAN
jgi:hypothetical protein